MCRPLVEPLKFVLSLKFVVSTTSVSPSQWPRESPSHNRTRANFPIGWIHDKRCAMCLDDVCCPIPPEIVVRCFNVSFWILKASLITVFFYRLPLELSCFLRCEKLPAGKLSRTLQRCDAVIIPNALEVWVTPCRFRRCR